MNSNHYKQTRTYVSKAEKSPSRNWDSCRGLVSRFWDKDQSAGNFLQTGLNCPYKLSFCEKTIKEAIKRNRLESKQYGKAFIAFLNDESRKGVE